MIRMCINSDTCLYIPNRAKIPINLQNTDTLVFEGFMLLYKPQQVMFIFRSPCDYTCQFHGKLYHNQTPYIGTHQILEFKCTVKPKDKLHEFEYEIFPNTCFTNDGEIEIKKFEVHEKLISTLNIANRDKYIRQTYVIYNPNKEVKVYYKDKEKIVKVVETTIVVKPKGE